MATATRTRKPRVKPQRSASLTVMTDGKLCLWIHEDGVVRYSYVLPQLASDFGVADRLGKATVEGCSDDYDVLLNGAETTCPGHTYRHTCKTSMPWKHLSELESCPALPQDRPSHPIHTISTILNRLRGGTVGVAPSVAVPHWMDRSQKRELKPCAALWMDLMPTYSPPANARRGWASA